MLMLMKTFAVVVFHSLCNGHVDATVSGCPAPDALPFSTPTLQRTDGREASLSVTTQVRPGDWVWYRCDPGHALVGRRRRQCQQDGTWEADAPSCYPNLAEGSQLFVDYWNMVDGNISSFEVIENGVLETKFYTLDSKEDMKKNNNIYAHEVRIVSGMDTILTEWAAILQYNDFSVEIPLKDFAVEDFQIYRKYSGSFQRDSNSGRLQKLMLSDKSGRRGDLKINELQVLGLSIDDSDVNSRISLHRCSPRMPESGLLRSWSDGVRCYHLVESTGTNADAAAAEEKCRGLGNGGTLAQIDSKGLHDMIKDILSYESHTRKWSEEQILVAGRRLASSGTWMLHDKEWRTADRITNTKLKTVGCAILKQIAKWFVEAWDCGGPVQKILCQTEPETCGSPERQLGIDLRPAPSPQIDAFNVTCAGDSHVSGQIVCRGHHWTQATFCQLSALTTILGAVGAAVLLLVVGCVAVWALRRHRRKTANDAPAWQPYAFLQRVGHLSRRYSRRQRRPRQAPPPQPKEEDDEHIYSEMIYADPGDSGYDHDSIYTTESPLYTESWPPGSGELVSPATEVVEENVLYETSRRAHQTSVTEYSLPLDSGRSLENSGKSCKLSVSDTSGDGATSAVMSSAGGEYCVPYEASRREAECLSSEL